MGSATTAPGRGWPAIHAIPRIPPLIGDYRQTRDTFTWDGARTWLDGLPGGAINIAHEAVDRHADGPHGKVTALRCIGRDGALTELTYAQLRAKTNHFASALRALGVDRGDAVCTLLARGPELYVTALGALKNGSVYCPLFPAFGPGPVQDRLSLGAVTVVVTTAAAYRHKIASARGHLRSLKHVLVTGSGPFPEGTESFDAAMAAADASFAPVPTRPEDPALLHFTSGTTGKPKGAVHVHEAVVAHYTSTVFAREELKLDSLDFLVLVERLCIRAHCRIDENDYPALRTMGGSIRLLVSRTSQDAAKSL